MSIGQRPERPILRTESRELGVIGRAKQVYAWPLPRLIVHEAGAMAAVVVVFALVRLTEVGIDSLIRLRPVTDEGPSTVLHLTFAWGGAFAAAAMFLAYTGYEIRHFARLLKRRDAVLRQQESS